MRWGDHHILMQRPDLSAGYAGIEGAGMTGDPQRGGPGARRTGVSLFRPGQPLPRGTMTIDHPADPAAMVPQVVFAAPSPARVWDSLAVFTPDPLLLGGNRLFPAVGGGAVPFDVLRTRLWHAMTARGWHRLAVTAPLAGSGTSLVAANLALSFGRMAQTRTVLVDLGLRRPYLHHLFGATDVQPLADWLSGDQPLEGHFLRLGGNLALGLNGAPVDDPSAVLLAPQTADALDQAAASLQPDVMLFDLPPALAGDEAAAILPQVDAVLMVVDATRTTAAEIKAAERALQGLAPLIGVVLNRAEGRN
jgi:Mrp family chromosome partitioning ATPase